MPLPTTRRPARTHGARHRRERGHRLLVRGAALHPRGTRAAGVPLPRARQDRGHRDPEPGARRRPARAVARPRLPRQRGQGGRRGGREARRGHRQRRGEGCRSVGRARATDSTSWWAPTSSATSPSSHSSSRSSHRIARVVAVGSIAHRFAHLDPGHPRRPVERPPHFRQYGRSKASLMAFAFELARRWSGSSRSAVCAHPATRSIRSPPPRAGLARCPASSAPWPHRRACSCRARTAARCRSCTRPRRPMWPAGTTGVLADCSSSAGRRHGWPPPTRCAPRTSGRLCGRRRRASPGALPA